MAKYRSLSARNQPGRGAYELHEIVAGQQYFFQTLETIMSVSTAYDYTCRFCAAVNSVFVSLDVALRATSAAANGDHEKAKDIVLAQ